jgi:hypothetical protein
MYVDVLEYVIMYDRLVNPFEWRDYYERPHKRYVDCCKNPCKDSID